MSSKDLAGRSPERFLAAVAERFTVAAGTGGTGAAGAHCDVPQVACGAHCRRRRLPIPTDAIASLDVSVLQDGLLAPILGIADVRTDKRIDFVGGARGTRELERLVDSGRFAVAFSLFPVSVADLMAVSDAGAIMPPKSTWFEPKLRDGLADSCDLIPMKSPGRRQVRTERARRLGAAGCEVVYQPDLKDEALRQAIVDTRRRRAGRAWDRR